MKERTKLVKDDIKCIEALAIRHLLSVRTSTALGRLQNGSKWLASRYRLRSDYNESLFQDASFEIRTRLNTET